MSRMSPTRHRLAAVVLFVFVAASCGGSEASSTATETGAGATASAEVEASADSETPGIRLVSAAEGLAIQADPPEGLVVLDVRTLEEFDEGHLDGATMIDFYRDDFAEQLADLDPDVPYLLYCRSGNRSGQTRAIMKDLGFADVADIDGGIISWNEAGQPTVTP